MIPINLMKLFRTILLLILPFTPNALAAEGNGDERKVVFAVRGSDFIPQELIQQLDAFSLARDEEPDIRMEGSLLGLAEFESGKADMVIYAHIGDPPEEAGYPIIPLAHQVAVIAVRQDNPIEIMTRNQLASIFTTGRHSVMGRWQEVGLSGEWRNRAILPVITRSTRSPVIDLFLHRYAEGRGFRDNIQSFETAMRLEVFLNNTEGSIGILDRLPGSDTIKAIRVEDPATRVAFSPTIENINFGDYPLTITYYIAVPRSLHRQLAPHIRFLLSEEAADILTLNGFVPLLETTRNSLVAELPSD